MKADHPFERHPAGSYHSQRSCRACGRVPEVHPDPPADPWTPRDLTAERLVVQIAVTGFAMDAVSIDALADARAHPGPVLVQDRDFLQEVREELADARNYIVWKVAYDLQPRAAAGDAEAAAEIPLWLDRLRKVIAAWHAHQ